MLSILILSQKGEGKEIADKLISEGHVVKFWIEHQEDQPSGSPAVYPWQTIDRYEEALLTADLCVFTSSGIRGLAEDLRKRGKVVVGGAVQDLLLKDPGVREAALRLMSLPSVVPDYGVSISLCGWYDGGEWMTFLSHRYTRLMDGDRGPQFEMGCVLYPETSVIKELKPILDASSYRGFVCVEVKMTEDGLYFERFNLNLSVPEISAICEATSQPLGELMYNVAVGRLPSSKINQYGLSIKLLDLSSKGTFEPPKQATKHCHRTLDSHFLGYVSAGGSSPNEARRRAYRTVYNSTNIETIYRKDIGCNSIFEEA